MASGRQTGTVPKTKQNTRPKRHSSVNHMSNNLDWHDPFQPTRTRKDSNAPHSRHSDTGEDMYEDNAWGSGAMSAQRSDEDECRWVKSINLVPERGCAHRQENGAEEAEGTSEDRQSRESIEMKMAALMSLRSKHLQEAKQLQADEMQSVPSRGLRNKEPKRYQCQEESDRCASLESRFQTMQEFTNLLKALGRDELLSNQETKEGQQDVKKKMKEAMKKTQYDHLVSLLECEGLPLEGVPSVSSEEGEAVAGFTRSQPESEDLTRHDIPKQDNREQASVAAYLQMKDLKLEQVKAKLEYLKTLLARVEQGSEVLRLNGETSSHCSDPSPQRKFDPAWNSVGTVMEKLRQKKYDDHSIRKVKSNPGLLQSTSGISQDPWSSLPVGQMGENLDYSSDDADVDCDESPVKLKPSAQLPFMHGVPKPPSRGRLRESSANTAFPIQQMKQGFRNPRGSSIEVGDVHAPPELPVHFQDLNSPSSSNLAFQISQLRMQIDQMQLMYQNTVEKQGCPSHQSWLTPSTPLGCMQFMAPTSQWHQHQMLINSLNQCCQLIWHQQRELAGLRQALTMLQEDGNIYKCGYGNNLNFDPGLLWTQTSPQMLNNQVAPGNRANNYWDNFRSYSRQNLLSRNKRNALGDEPLTPSRVPKDNVRGNAMCGNTSRRVQLPHSNSSTSDINNPRGEFSAKPHDVLSLQQSIYSELETIIAESDQNPEMLLHVLSQLKTVKSQQNQNDLPSLNGSCDAMVPPLTVFSRSTPPAPSLSFGPEPPKVELILEAVNQMIQECEFFTPELLKKILMLMMHFLNLPQHHDCMDNLEVHLIKFQGARICQVAEEILCTVADIVSPGPVSVRNEGHSERSHNEQIEEEGAVGGVLIQSKRAPQKVDTELAEADQPQCTTSNCETFNLSEPARSAEPSNQDLCSREDPTDHQKDELQGN